MSEHPMLEIADLSVVYRQSARRQIGRASCRERVL